MGDRPLAKPKLDIVNVAGGDFTSCFVVKVIKREDAVL